MLTWFTDQGWFDRVTEIHLYGDRVDDEIVDYLLQFERLDALYFGPTVKLSPTAFQILDAELPNCRIDAPSLTFASSVKQQNIYPLAL